MIDLKRYYRLHPDGLCWTEHSGDDVKVFTKRFDNETGAALMPEYQWTTVQELEKEKLELQHQLVAIDLILNTAKE